MEVHMISMPRSNPKNESNSRACLYSGEIGTGESPALLDSTAKPYAKALLWLWRFPSQGFVTGGSNDLVLFTSFGLITPPPQQPSYS